MSDDIQAAAGHHGHTQGYLDGAPAEDAFQKLVDRGLLGTPSVPVAQPTATQPAAQPEVKAEAAPEAAAEPQTEEYSNLDEYLQKAGVDRTSFLDLPVPVKVDGKDSQIALKDLLRSYQTDAHVTQKSQALAEKQKGWEAEQTQARTALQQQFQTAQNLGNLAHQQLMGEYQSIDWNKLRAEDPTRWAVLNQEFNMRAGAIQQHLAQVNAAQQQQQQEAQQRQRQTLEAERSRMLEAFPAWRDSAKFQEARVAMSTYAQSIGLTDAELSGIFDHRYMKVLHDASQFAALQAKSPAALKIVRAAPAMASPGARTQRDPKSVRLQQVREAGRSGKLARNEDAQAAAFSALVNAGV